MRRSRFGDTPLQVLAYLAGLPLLHALSLLPLSALHRIADLAAFLSYRVLRLRREVVLGNLRRCFPDASPEEIDRLAMGGYRHAADVVMEVVHQLRADPDAIAARVDVDLGSAAPLLERMRSAVVVLGHSGNWEWAIPAAVRSLPGVRIHVVYHKLKHPGFDRFFRRLREQGGATLTPMGKAMRQTARFRHEPTATFLVADQRPRSRGGHPTLFFGEETAFFGGPERIARRFDMPVVYVAMDRVARGRYALRAQILCEEPSELAPGEILARFARQLEEQIRKAPENWLWTHRRWRDRRAERRAR